MIDTDKYEGHTEGPWRIVEGDSIYDENEYWLAIRSAKGFDVTELSGTTSDIGKSDWNLIADAPLLLAEVKRLREGLRRLLNPYQHGLSNDKEPLPKWLGDAVWELIE